MARNTKARPNTDKLQDCIAFFNAILRPTIEAALNGTGMQIDYVKKYRRTYIAFKRNDEMYAYIERIVNEDLARRFEAAGLPPIDPLTIPVYPSGFYYWQLDHEIDIEQLVDNIK